MRLGLGIDAGGTYTDTVLYDFGQKVVLGKGKALTTKDNYAIGIEASLAQIDIANPHAIEFVGLSTTLATNALVEGRGARAGLLLIGYDVELVQRFLQVSPYWIVAGGHDMRGRERASLDEKEVRRAVEAMADDVDVIAISEMGGAVNPEHEHRVQALIEKDYGIPAISGHEISTEMDSMKRATTVFWNARLIPILLDLIKAVKVVLRERGVRAPIMVERSDGTLMGEKLARRRPIETLMSGPVASVYGALHLSGCKDALVIDMGGTTTDIGLVRNGQPRLRASGASIGAYRTTVKTLDLHTTGLGGDSEIFITPEGGLGIGPRRVLPISYAARRAPAIAAELEIWQEVQTQHVDAALLPPVEFFIPTKKGIHQGKPGISKGSLEIGTQEQVAFQALQELGGASRFQLAKAIDYSYPSLLRMEHLESQGLVYRVGLTPTDVLHVLGRLELWETKAAYQAVEAFAHRWQTNVEAVCQRVIGGMQQRLAEQAVNVLLAESMYSGNGFNGVNGQSGPMGRLWTRRIDTPQMEECPICQYLLHTSLNKAENGAKLQDLECNMKVNLPIVAVGAPVKSYFPALAEALQTELHIPEHADVANAIGVATGNIALVMEVIVSFTGDEQYIIQGIPENNSFEELEEATVAAVAYVTEKVRQRAIEAGAEAISVDITQEDIVSEVGDGELQKMFLQRQIVARATGRPRTRE
jgi:N-methylhydantoinase A/oxoprolinase/acetone carboxylase beta subunit